MNETLEQSEDEIPAIPVTFLDRDSFPVEDYLTRPKGFTKLIIDGFWKGELNQEGFPQ